MHQHNSSYKVVQSLLIMQEAGKNESIHILLVLLSHCAVIALLLTELYYHNIKTPRVL